MLDKYTPVSWGDRSLKHAADGLGVYMGTALNYWQMTAGPAYSALVKKNYDLITAESVCKMAHQAKSDNQKTWDFSRCKTMAAYAKKNKMAMRGHTLIWPKNSPGWIEGYNKDRLESFMINYIKETVKQVGPYPFAWDVVNEALDEPYTNNFIRKSHWDIIPNFICKAFKAAKEANPNQGRFYNDYSIMSATGWMKKKSDNAFKLVKQLQD